MRRYTDPQHAKALITQAIRKPIEDILNPRRAASPAPKENEHHGTKS